jgi:hypothetical protein
VTRKWRALDALITDSLNEAKDNVKYLGQLEKYTEPLYGYAPDAVMDVLPALMNNIKMVLTISRYHTLNPKP